MTKDQRHVICRACHANCGLIVDFENDQPVATHGDKDNPAFFGYSCIKGRELVNYHSSPSRLRSSLKRQPNGAFENIHWRDAANEVADKIQSISEKYGPNSIALYLGTFGYNHLTNQSFAQAFMNSIGSHMWFTSVSIDQPGKGIAGAHHGAWLAGPYRIPEWDGLMIIGSNPLISQNGGLGVNPARNLHSAKKRGMELIVIDPRVTECAKKADLHLQIRPGEDVAVLAAIANILITEDLIDLDFIQTETDGLEALKQAVANYTPEMASKRAGVSAEDIVRAAHMLGSWQRGHISAGTGPNMSGFGNIVEYLALALTSLRGHWRREGEVRPNKGVFIKPAPPIAASSGPFPFTGAGNKLRTRNLSETLNGMPTAALAEEILTPGEGQIKALIVLGGNPVLAWPDQIRTVKAMKELDLLVCLDPRMSKTCDMADYVIAPKLHYEIHGTTALTEMVGNFGGGWGFERTYAQATPPIMPPPEGSDLCEEFEFFHTMAKRLNKTLNIASWALLNDPEARQANQVTIKPDQNVDVMDAWKAAFHMSPMPVEKAFADPAIQKGTIVEEDGDVIQAKPEGWPAKLIIGAERMMSELKRYEDENLKHTHEPTDFPFKLISRRLNAIHNSNWHEIPTLRAKMQHHPAYIHPEDLGLLGIEDGDVVEIESHVSSIKCVARSAPDVRQGCLAVPHSWGTSTDEEDDPLGAGGNTGRLTDNTEVFDKITGIPIMSAIPVRIRSAS